MSSRRAPITHCPGGKSVEAASSVFASKPSIRFVASPKVLCSAREPSTIRRGAGSTSALSIMRAASGPGWGTPEEALARELEKAGFANRRT
jgi:hypothetical protein